MKFRIPTNNLKAALAAVLGGINKKEVIPILSYVLIESDAAGKQLRFTATDLDLTIQTHVPAEIVEGGSMCIHAQKLDSLVKLATDDELEINREPNGFAVIKTGRGKFKIPAEQSDSFPSMPPPPSETVEISGKTFAEMATRTSFAITNEPSRFTLAGAKFILDSGNATMVSTDGHRLALSTRENGLPDIEKVIDVLIPKAGLTAIARLLADEDIVQFGADANIIFAASETVSIHSRLLTGQFPAYQQILPKALTGSFTANLREMRDAVKRVSLMSDARYRKLHIKIGNGELELSARSSEDGDGRELVPAECITEEETTLSFDWHYVLQYLDLMNASADAETTVKGSFSGRNDAVEWNTNIADDADRYIVMPLRA